MGLFSDITGKGILGGAMGLAGGIFGGIARRRAMKKNLAMLEEKKMRMPIGTIDGTTRTLPSALTRNACSQRQRKRL